MRKKKKKSNGLDLESLTRATATHTNTANMSVPSTSLRPMGMKKGGLCKGMGKATRGGKFGRNG